MGFQTGFDPNRGPGRAKGQKDKKTRLVDALKIVYGGDGETPFWERVAETSQSLGPNGAACMKMIADRLSPTLKAVELSGDGGAPLQITIARFTPEVLKEPEKALELGGTSTVVDVTPALEAEAGQEVGEE